MKKYRITSLRCPEHGEQNMFFVRWYFGDGTLYCTICHRSMTVEQKEIYEEDVEPDFIIQ